MRNVPVHVVSRLTKFTNGGVDYFAMRNDSAVNFFNFSCETKQLTDAFNYCLPKDKKYNFYDHKGPYIYFSTTNPHTSF